MICDRKVKCWVLALSMAACLQWGLQCAAIAAPYYAKQENWRHTLLAARSALDAARLSAADRAAPVEGILGELEFDFPEAWDWLAQDSSDGFRAWFQTGQGTSIERAIVRKVFGELGSAAGELKRQFDGLNETDSSSDAWLELYSKACELRRADRLKSIVASASEWVFVKNRTVMPSFFAYTEGQSDAQNERHFLPGAALCRLKMDGLYAKTEVLLEDAQGAIRDPDVSLNGAQVLFAWKKSLNQDDYHLYEIDINTKRMRQITTGLGFADYEGCYVPGNGIVFSSTRCVQTVDCWWTEVSNLYTCDRDGRYLRRLGFDQVHSIHPALTDDGRVLYTRWDYNDRGQIFPQGLFQMNPDGTGQAEFYGNNSWFPTTIAHARGVPGSQKVVAIFTGHHSPQAGKLGLLDPSKGRQENSGAQLIAPLRDTPAERIDSYGQRGELFQHPYPLSEKEFLVAYAPKGWQRNGGRSESAHFSLYWMDIDGHRELLASDREYGCRNPVAVISRENISPRPSLVDYRKSTGTYYMQDVYVGPGLKGTPRGTVKKLRVVALEFRPAGVGNNSNGGQAGGALVSTPISIGNGCWDVKKVLGDTPVYEDGSAYFIVPARTPVYFQALDAKGHVVQTMRSWSTLQPGENQSCVGCHESKNSAPPVVKKGTTMAAKAGALELDLFYGAARGFSFNREIQPILDRHCVSCHNDRGPALASNGTKKFKENEGKADATKAFSLLGETTPDATAKRRWSDAYLYLTQSRTHGRTMDDQAFLGDCDGKRVNWISPQSEPGMLAPYSSGACKSGLMPFLEKGHRDVQLSREELEKIACWIDLAVPYCGDYAEASDWSDEETAKYRKFVEKRKKMESEEESNIAALLKSQGK
jgi:hypothetical protein